MALLSVQTTVWFVCVMFFSFSFSTRHSCIIHALLFFALCKFFFTFMSSVPSRHSCMTDMDQSAIAITDEENIQKETRATPLAVHLFSSALSGVWSSFFSFLWLDHHSVQWACRPLFFSPSLAEGEGGDVLSAGGVGSIPQRNAPQLLQRAVEKAPRLFQLHEKFPANENSDTFLFQI